MIKNYKKRLFEMMNRVSGMPLIKEIKDSSELPPGISLNDLISLEDYEKQVPCTNNVNEENPNNFGAKLKPVDNIDKLLRNKESEIGNKKQNYNTGGRIHSRTISNIKTDDGFNVDKLKNILSLKPTTKQFLTQNGKMGKSNFFNVTLPAFKGLIYNQEEDKFYVVSVCDKASGCLQDCYAQMGRYIMFDATVKLNTQKLNYLMNHWREWEERMINTIKTLSFGGGSVIRWHDSGDFLSEKYLLIAYDIAKATPNDHHYAYTKEVAMVLQNQAPDNFEFKFSYGGKEDNLIDTNKHGYARVIPEELFNDLQPNGKGNSWSFTPEGIDILLDRIADRYKLDRSTLITNNELMNIPYNPKDNHERKWNVVNWSGNDDVPALKKNVLGVYNLKHR